jgi:hypothetical protein
VRQAKKNHYTKKSILNGRYRACKGHDVTTLAACRVKEHLVVSDGLPQKRREDMEMHLKRPIEEAVGS